MLEEAIERIGGTIHAFELVDADDTTVMASVKIDLRPHNRSLFTYNMVCNDKEIKDYIISNPYGCCLTIYLLVAVS